jgi:hypothetical protein
MSPFSKKEEAAAAPAVDSSVSNPEISTKEGSIEVDYVNNPEGRAGGYDEKATKALLRKIDWTLIPFLAVLYLLSFLDRTNIGNARLAGLETDLGMSGLDYNVALAVFFPFYVAAEIPSNMAMKRFRPSIWIPSIMVYVILPLRLRGTGPPVPELGFPCC